MGNVESRLLNDSIASTPGRAPAWGLRGSLRALFDSITRFNRRWGHFLDNLDLSNVNAIVAAYNRYYLLEKECAMRSPRLAAKGFEPARELTREEIERRFPLLPMPKLATRVGDPMHHDDDAHLKPVDERAIFAISRPHPRLLTLYIVRCLFATVAFPFVFLPCYFRYITLRYRFDEEGVAVSWGFFFRKETYLTYTRIQDIHVSRGILERWLGLGTVEIQTAAGSSQAEEAIVGVTEFDAIRNFLYARMRGHELHSKQPESASAPTDDAETVLREIRDELHAIRTLVQERRHV